MTDPEDRTSAPGGQPSPADSPSPPDDVPAAPVPPSESAGEPSPTTEVEAAPPVEVEPAPTVSVEPAPAAEVEPAPAAEVEPAPTAEVEPAPTADVEPVTAPAKAAATPAAAPAASSRPEFEEEEDDSGTATDDLQPIPRWVALVNTLGVGLVVVMAAWTIAAIVQGLYYPSQEGQGITNDVLHRLGTPFVPTHWVLVMVTLIIAVVLLSLPVLLEEDVTYGQERAASITLVVVIVLALIVCVGAILSVRSALHAVTAQGQAVPSFYRVDRTAYLLAVLGTGLLAAYGALVARGMRYGTD